MAWIHVDQDETIIKNRKNYVVRFKVVHQILDAELDLTVHFQLALRAAGRNVDERTLSTSSGNLRHFSVNL